MGYFTCHNRWILYRSIYIGDALCSRTLYCYSSALSFIYSPSRGQSCPSHKVFPFIQDCSSIIYDDVYLAIRYRAELIWFSRLIGTRYSLHILRVLLVVLVVVDFWWLLLGDLSERISRNQPLILSEFLYTGSSSFPRARERLPRCYPISRPTTTWLQHDRCLVEESPSVLSIEKRSAPSYRQIE